MKRVLGGLSCDVDPKANDHMMYFLIYTPPPKPGDITTFAGAYAHHVNGNWQPFGVTQGQITCIIM